MNASIQRPLNHEYGDFYAGYIQRVPEGNILELLEAQIAHLKQVLAPINDQNADFRYAPNQWSIREMLGHINDTERIFSYRALRISRNDKTPLSGFEQDDFVRESDFSFRTFQDLLSEFEHLRHANLLAFRTLNPETSQRMGTASNSPVSVRALLYMMCGHVNWHIESLITEYLPSIQ